MRFNSSIQARKEGSVIPGSCSEDVEEFEEVDGEEVERMNGFRPEIPAWISVAPSMKFIFARAMIPSKIWARSNALGVYWNLGTPLVGSGYTRPVSLSRAMEI